MAMPAHSTAFPQVRHKQQEGTVILSDANFTFQPLGTNPNGQQQLQVLHIPWSSIKKHQVSPASHSKALLKLSLLNSTENGCEKSLTFRMVNRNELERIRKDVTKRLHPANNGNGNDTHKNVATTKKRTHAELTAAEFGHMDRTSLAVTRSSLLSSNATLRAQHYYLVTETQTLTEEDFWKTHAGLEEEEYAKICGTTKTGPSSLLQSHLVTVGDNKITLGVEEMRQIFIMYPAVHKAYEEKVPLELSDEQFWRKYLESEFFHRDRGKLGTAARNHQSSDSKKKGGGLTDEQQDARAAAVGTDDLFARYDQKLRESGVAVPSASTGTEKKRWGTNLAVGQFDLASTFETERGQLLEGPRDIHPPNDKDNGRGSRIVQKYNRHWAMVLHPDDAVAGSDLQQVARKSVTQVLPGDADAKARGGVGEEMERLVNFANASELDANHVTGTGLEDEDYEDLNLNNVEAYSYRRDSHNGNNNNSNESEEDANKRRKLFAQAMIQKISRFAQTASGEASILTPQDCCPDPSWGRKLLQSLTKRMTDDAKTDEDRMEAVNRLEPEFKKKLDTYFRRSSELLRHFFGIRKLENASSASGAGGVGANEQKLTKVVDGLTAVYREMEKVRHNLPQNEVGLMMGKMILPIMEQLDAAFQLHREAGSTNGGGGFVDVGGGFVDVN